MGTRRLPWASQIAAVLTLIGCGGSAITCLGCSNSQNGGKGAAGGGAGTAGTMSGGTSGSGGGGAGMNGTCEGNRYVNNNADFEELVAEGCAVITGNLRISSLTVSSLNGLQSLTSVGGELAIGNAGIDSLSGLERLTSVGGALSIVNTDISNLSELSSITSVGGTLGIGLNPMLTRLGPLHDWPSDAVVGVIGIAYNSQLPQCEVEAFDAAQVNAACDEGSCVSNDGTGTCP